MIQRMTSMLLLLTGGITALGRPWAHFPAAASGSAPRRPDERGDDVADGAPLESAGWFGWRAADLRRLSSEVRVPVMIVAAAEKLVLGGLVIASPLRTRLVTLAVVSADAVMALLYMLLLTQNVT